MNREISSIGLSKLSNADFVNITDINMNAGKSIRLEYPTLVGF